MITPRLGEDDVQGLAEALRVELRTVLGGTREVRDLVPLSGGASRDTWSFDVVNTTGGITPLILRRDPPGAAADVMGREAAVLSAAATAGVPVPRVLLADLQGRAFGSPALVMERVPGETLPRRILEGAEYAALRDGLAGSSGRILARIHTIPPATVPGLVDEDPLDWCEQTLRRTGIRYPSFELALRRLRETRPAPTAAAPVVLHGDYRLGNLMVGPDRIRSVLDWELTHLGDPLEDLAWLCTKAWRFGEVLPVAGVGRYEDLVTAYAAESGIAVSRDSMHWWEALSTLKWGVMCVNQAGLHLRGVQRSVELAAVGRRAAEAEWDLLHLMYGIHETTPRLSQEPVPGTVLDRPTGAELMETVREFVETDILPEAEGRLRYLVRVVANLLQIAEREQRHATEIEGTTRTLAESLGVHSSADLADAIRAGRVDPDDPAVVAAVETVVRMKLEVANPGYLCTPFPDAEPVPRSA